MKVIKDTFRIVFKKKDDIKHTLILKPGRTCEELGMVFQGYVPDRSDHKQHLLVGGTYSAESTNIEDLSELEVLTFQEVKQLLGTHIIIVYE